jgi:hypothetical protein
MPGNGSAQGILYFRVHRTIFSAVVKDEISQLQKLVTV